MENEEKQDQENIYQPVKCLSLVWKHNKPGQWSEFSAYLFVPEQNRDEYKLLLEERKIANVLERFKLSNQYPDEKWWTWEDPDQEAEANPKGPTPEEFHAQMRRKFGVIKGVNIDDVAHSVHGPRPFDPSDGV